MVKMKNMKNKQEISQYEMNNFSSSAKNSPFRGLGGSNIIVGIGEILWDVFPGGKVLGGAPANFAYHVSQYGLQGYAVSAIGADALGKEIIDTLASKKLKNLVSITDFPTGTVQVTVDNQGIPQYEICENVAWDNIPFSNELETLARNTIAVCFGSLAQRNSVSRNTINKFLKLLSPEAIIIFDINLRQYFYTKELICESLLTCNILKINDEEVIEVSKFFDWSHLTELDICYQLLKDFSLNMIILTRGMNGSYVITENERYFKPTPVVKVADTVGAGDSFIAAFVSSILNGKSISQAHSTAVNVSAYVCTQHGAMPEVPSTLLNM